MMIMIKVIIANICVLSWSQALCPVLYLYYLL